jgi:glycosyltransferase involved in cell wall biosynthesis
VAFQELIEHPTRGTQASDGREPPMVVAVEATRLQREVRGIGRYVRALLPRLLAQRPGLRLVLFVKNRHHAEAAEAIFASLPALRGVTEIRPVREMARFDADVFWYPWNVANPLPDHGAVVVTIHDVAPLAFPDPRISGWHKNLRWRRRYGATARAADIIVADSTFTADEVHRYLRVPYDRMRVVLLAADDLVVPPVEGDRDALARLGVRQPFVLAVGAADRRKNLALVERAMARVVTEHPGTVLVLAGPRSEKTARTDTPSWVHTLGFVSDEDLATVYRCAKVLVMPSIYEGFGLPVLEAMRLGTPVICARASSLPEVAGDAALWVDGEDDGALATSIGRVLSDERLSASMRAASLAQARKFSWDETARRTIAAFEEAALMKARVSSHATT